jgi:LPXTG-motif cell wall-anchored protein
MKKIIVITVALLLIFGMTGTAFAVPGATSIWVDDDYTAGDCGGHTWGVDAFSTIGEGVTAAAAGDTVYVASGSYTENVNVDKEITLQGEDPSDTSVDGHGNPVFYVTADNVSISGFCAYNGGTNEQANIVLAGVTGCTVKNNLVGWATAGIGLISADNNTVSYNKCSENNYGIVLDENGGDGSSGNTVENNEIYDITYDGIYLGEFCDGNDIEENTCHGNGGSGIYLWKVVGNTVKDNTLTDNTGCGLHMFSAKNTTVTGNTITGNDIGVLLRSGVEIDSSGNAVNENVISGNTTFGAEVRETRNPADLILNAENNYWGAEDGPSGEGPGGGDAVSEFVDYDPYYVNEEKDTLSDAEFTVTFEDYNGDVLKTETVVYGNAATAPADPARSGYTFDGWDKAFDNITEDLTVTAQYTADAEQKITISGTLLDGLGNPLSGYTIELYSDPVIVVTDGAGEFTFTDTEIGTHTLIVKDSSDTTLKTFTLNITEGGSFSWTDVDGSQIDIVITGSTGALELTLTYDGADVTMDDVDGIENPKTGDTTNNTWMIWAAMLVIAAAALLAVGKKRRASAKR